MNIPTESGATACCDIAATIDCIRLTPDRREELVEFLAEQAPVYRGLGSKEVERLRGYLLASFETLGLPDTAMPFVLEELEVGPNPYTVAAAAKALRGASHVPDRAVSLLIRAVERIAGNDDYVQYDTLRPSRAAFGSTALVEIFRTISALGPRAGTLRAELDAMAERSSAFSPDVLVAIEQARHDVSAPFAGQSCCSVRPPPVALQADYAATPIAIDNLPLEDQGGAHFTYRDFFHGRPSVVTFFYTRCMNPDKCSLTISKLARLQRLFRNSDLQSRINLAAFTYDPAYDRPERLHAYGLERGLRYDERNKLIRTQGLFMPLQRKFDLGVGFGPSTINRHSVELFVLDSAGAISQEFRRVQWDELVVLRTVKQLIAH
jgi:protein SCO1